MTPTAKLKNEITTDPEGIGYSGKTAQQVHALLHTENRPFVVEGTRVSELGILAAFADPSDGTALLNKLHAAAAVDDVVKYTLKWLEPNSSQGLDVGSTKVRTFIDGLQTASVVTATEANTIKALAEKTVSRAQELELACKLGHVEEAMA